MATRSNGKDMLRPESRFDTASWAVLCLAMLIIGLAFVETVNRLSLPWDGWSFINDATGSGQVLIFDQQHIAGETPLRAGDRLLSVQGQPFEDILSRALTLDPQRPLTWKEGQTARYVVLRDGSQVGLTVSLIRLTPGQVLSGIGRTWVINPSVLPALLIALFVFFKRPRSAAARLFLILSASFFASNGIQQAITGSNIVGIAEMFYPEAYWPAQFYNQLIWPFVIGPVYAHLFLLFPVRKAPLVRHPRLTMAQIYGTVPAAALLIATIYRGQPLAAWNAWSVFCLVDLVAVVVIVLASAGHTLMSAQTATQRAQIRWLAWGAIITSIGALSGSVLGSLGWLGHNALVDLLVYRLLFLAFPITLAIAILRYRLFDIDFVIRRTLIYGVLSGILAVIYFSSVIVLQQVFTGVIGPGDNLAIALSTLAIAALFGPLRQRIQTAIDRRFYRDKYDASRILDSFSSTARDQVDLPELADSLFDIVQRTLQPEQVSLWLTEPTDGDASTATTE